MDQNVSHLKNKEMGEGYHILGNFLRCACFNDKSLSNLGVNLAKNQSCAQLRSVPACFKETTGNVVSHKK